MSKRIPTPFKYRGGWRASVTLPGGKRRARDFEKHQDAKDWIVQMLGDAAEASGHEPKLGGPTEATLADALTYYASQWTVNKGGARAELNRINHYLSAAGEKRLRLHVDPKGTKSVVEDTAGRTPAPFAAYGAKRLERREETYKTIARLARRLCSKISTADLRELMTTMAREGLSPSTIQKEIALLRHVFNVAVTEWSWLGFRNPCLGLKLGKSATRFVVLTTPQVHALMLAASGCDNPLVPAAIGLALDSAMRKSSLLSLAWADINLENRTLQVGSKTGDVVLALSQTTLAILENLPRGAQGRVLPLSDNALNMAWEGVREKAGLPKLQFRDLRHVAATRLAKQGMSAHHLQRVLGHKTITMAQVYVNMVQSDMIEVLDKLAPLDPVLVVEPMGSDVKAEIRRRRSERITGALRQKAQALSCDSSQPEPAVQAGPVEVAATCTTSPSFPESCSDESAAVDMPSEQNEATSGDAIAARSTVLRVDFRARRVVNG